MTLSTVYANAVLDSLLGSGSPATVYAALYTATPTVGGGGTEVAGGSYARVALTNNATNFPPAAAASKHNGTSIVFPKATALWGTVIVVGLHDAAVGDHLIVFGALDIARVIASGNTANFLALALTFSAF